jgi:hypothetical protein
MIGNPFLYRAADSRSGTMADDRNFVNLFGISALGLIKEKMQGLWDLPLFLISAPGGGKSSLMRVFSASAMRYIQETASLGGNQQSLADQMQKLEAFKNEVPHALGIWLRMSSEYHALYQGGGSNSHGLFCAMLNSRIILSALNGICELNGITLKRGLNRIRLILKPGANNITIKSYSKWGSENGEVFYNRMARLEADLCDMIDDPFWEGSPSNLSHSRIWAIDLLANVNILLDDKPLDLRPLIMIDDANELLKAQLQYLFGILMSRQAAVPFWISMRKQALELHEILTERIDKGVERGRDYEIINFEKDIRGFFRKCVLEISELRVQSVRAQIGGLSQAFTDFLSDNREEFLLKKLDDRVAQEIKSKVLAAAGSEIKRFRILIDEIQEQCSEPNDLCKRLRLLEILIQREMGKKQRSLFFQEVSRETFDKHESNIAIVEAAELFLAKDYKLPYYFGAPRLLTLSSFNIQQFLLFAGALFKEIMTAIRLDRDRESFLSPERQHAIVRKVSADFLKEIPSKVHYGNRVLRFIYAIGNMCKNETYRPTAPYAPGVTGTAITMYEFDILAKGAKKGDKDLLELYETIESAIAYNILEPEPNYRCKQKEFLVLYLNRLLCINFELPLQKGGFREQKLSTLLQWMKPVSVKLRNSESQAVLWE